MGLVYATVYFNDQRRHMAVEVNDESLDDLLPPEVEPSPAIPPEGRPQQVFFRCHLAPQGLREPKLDRVDWPSQNNSGDRH